MNGRVVVRCARLLLAAAVTLLLVLPAHVRAQAGGAGQAEGSRSAREAAPVDLTGYWISIVTEDWLYRMVTPAKGDYASLPLNAEGRRVADAWDPAADEAAGEACKAYGVAAVMRRPGRIRISWENDTTLRIDTEAGTQTRLLHFGSAPAEAGERTWQGRSVAQWQYAGGRRAPGGPPGGSLLVHTTDMRPGYLRKNGVPYAENAVVTEYIHRIPETYGDEWLVITTVVDDPKYLNQRFTTSTHFKKLPDGADWSPMPCSAT